MYSLISSARPPAPTRETRAVGGDGGTSVQVNPVAMTQAKNGLTGIPSLSDRSGKRCVSPRTFRAFQGPEGSSGSGAARWPGRGLQDDQDAATGRATWTVAAWGAIIDAVGTIIVSPRAGCPEDGFDASADEQESNRHGLRMVMSPAARLDRIRHPCA